MRKGPGHFAAKYSSGRENFIRMADEAYKIGPSAQSKLGYHTLDYASLEVLAMAALNFDPRNHYGKYFTRCGE